MTDTSIPPTDGSGAPPKATEPLREMTIESIGEANRELFVAVLALLRGKIEGDDAHEIANDVTHEFQKAVLRHERLRRKVNSVKKLQARIEVLEAKIG